MLEIIRIADSLLKPEPHRVLQMNRIIVIMENPKCEKCGNGTIGIHHKDKDASNHALSNLMVLCNSCHHRLHGQEVRDLALKYDLSVPIVRKRRKIGIPLGLPRNAFSRNYKYLFKRYPSV